MFRLRLVVLITVIATVTVLLLLQIKLKNIPSVSLQYASNWNLYEMRLTSVDTKETCVKVPRLSNVSITVRGYDVQLRANNTWNATKHLNVLVILHSHVDPGWLYTFEDYYSSSEKPVRKIMNNVVNSLRKHPDLRFIWSEVSFLERWWSEANTTYKQYFRRLVDEGRLEISGGSWVMTDEATPHFWATVDNMIVGHQYVQKILNFTPTTSWSVDPFGHGLMIPYLLTLTGIRQMVIGRINTKIKDVLKKNHQLHFRWAQTWDPEARWAPLVNVLPNTYYTVIDACGTDGTICCQFDVSNSARSSCTERARVDTKEQITAYAERMAAQYRSLQPFYYNSHTILIAAGDDFLYSDPDDLEIVHQVYSTLFNYINKHQKQFNMNVRFGTVADYFKALKRSEVRTPVLDGDFFPYMDSSLSSTPFWTGFYNHRAYFKRFERIVQSELRSLDLLSVISRKEPSNELELARRNLALSQHHDAITGTSTREVMNDYMYRLRSALRTILIEQESLLNNSTSDKTFTSVYVGDFNATTTGMYLSVQTLRFHNGVKTYHVQIVNQKAFRTMELLKLITTSPFVYVKYSDQTLTTQGVRLPDANLYVLSFFVPLQPFSVTTVSVKENQNKADNFTENILRPAVKEQLDGEIILKNKYLTLHWNTKYGQTHRLVYNDGSLDTKFGINFTSIQDNGGAYTMVTQGSFQDIHREPLQSARLIKGSVYSSIWQQLSPEIAYSIAVMNSPDDLARALQLDIFTNVRSKPGYTFFMNFTSSIQNGANFYTDVNGMYLIKRSYTEDESFEANVYPMTVEAMIEDDKLRCTILGAQPTGVTFTQGTIMLMLDREMIADDGKGLPYNEASESHPSNLKYRVIFEPKVSLVGEFVEKKQKNESLPVNVEDVIYHSQFVQQNLEELLYPADLFLSANVSSNNVKNLRIAALPSLPDNIQIVTARYIAPKTILISLRQLPYDCSTEPHLKSNFDKNLIRQFFLSFGGTIYVSNLTGTKTGSQISPEIIPSQLTQPLHIVSFLVKLI